VSRAPGAVRGAGVCSEWVGLLGQGTLISRSLFSFGWVFPAAAWKERRYQGSYYMGRCSPEGRWAGPCLPTPM